ncbi:SRPBCC family protein [Polymorphobacter arshaanensis]|uniref:SRPBCC family protein n=1 Tax=Glacieibacterium arshaanense TaxID=2511025 RepID=A0A4Y9ER52_9SPHN|nr:SRPBCC family protein [Polymorphobacter arshaanensis]TFU06106.1 SRPBCC family protein [Polymorphobacter arshaanensis]
MASICHEITIEVAADRIWDAVRDVGALHSRLVPGFVITTDMINGANPPTRVVTFANGTVLKERIVACDSYARRLVWSIEDASVVHHNGAIQVFANGSDRSTVVWTADVLPDTLAEPFGGFMTTGLAVMKSQLESC